MHRDADAPASPTRIQPDAILHEAAKVVRRLTRHGFKAHLVGGCVRDLLLGRAPKDFDIATNARPRQIKRLFRNSRIIGRRFRLVHIRFGSRILEVATFRAPPRSDNGDGNGDDDEVYIHRDNVFGTEKEDAFRRDFTINALFYDIARERVIDHVGGLEDLAAKRLRTIGDPDLRLREDPVRILRAAKFAGRLGFALESGLAEAMRAHARDLDKAPVPRLLEELYRLVSGRGSAICFRLLEELGALRVLLPEITPLPFSFFDALRRIEKRWGGDRDATPQWLMLAVLVSPRARGLLLEGPIHEIEVALQDQLQPIFNRLTVARRDATLARQGLAVQRRLLEAPRDRTARRFARSAAFPGALLLRRVLGPLDSVEPDPLPEWEALRAELPEPAPESERPPPRRRRRRRRGGRRRPLRDRKGSDKDEA